MELSFLGKRIDEGEINVVLQYMWLYTFIGDIVPLFASTVLIMKHLNGLAFV